MYHGLARHHLMAPGFLMRPLLNGGTLGGPLASDIHQHARLMPSPPALAFYSLYPVLVVALAGNWKARSAKAGWIAWVPVLSYLALIGAHVLLGFTNAAIADIVRPLLYTLELASFASGVWLFFKFRVTARTT
jgi:hypothetical protein